MNNALDTASLPWIPLGNGESFKPLRFYPNDRGRALLLRVEPGKIIPRHRHLGEVHGFTLSGLRQLDTGEIAGPGAYVYEPTGNVDSWTAIGDEPAVIHIISFGAMEYLGDDDQVLRRDTAGSLRELYVNYCREHGITPLDLG